MDAAEEIAAASVQVSSGLETNEPDEIYEALTKYVPSDCYVDGMALGMEYINEIYLMLVNHFQSRLSPEVVQIACGIYFSRACQYDQGNIVMKIKVDTPVGFFRKCYEDAIKQYKAQRNRGLVSQELKVKQERQ